MYIIKNENGLYYKKSRSSGWSNDITNPENWTDDINKARIFSSTGACKNSSLGEDIKNLAWEEYLKIPYQARKMLNLEQPNEPRVVRHMKKGFVVVRIEVKEVE